MGKKTGVWKNYDLEGNIVSSGTMLEGRKDGLWTEQLDNGEKAEGNYVKDRRSGDWIFYSSGKRIIRKGSYADNLENGIGYLS